MVMVRMNDKLLRVIYCIRTNWWDW